MSHLERRDALRLLGLGALSVGCVVSIRPLVAGGVDDGFQGPGRDRNIDLADQLSSSNSGPLLDSDFETILTQGVGPADLEILPSQDGSNLHRARLVELRVEHGSIVADMKRSDGQSFKIQIYRRDEATGAPEPIARTRAYDLFLANSGQGNTKTHEEEGLTIYALASRVAEYEKSNPVLRLDTKRQWWARDFGKRQA